jgi:hypothetical protein
MSIDRATLNQRLLDTALFQNCANCVHLEERSNRPSCMKWNATPPAKVIALGCEAWEREVPF